jgi:hypothetical protein
MMRYCSDDLKKLSKVFKKKALIGGYKVRQYYQQRFGTSVNWVAVWAVHTSSMFWLLLSNG